MTATTPFLSMRRSVFRTPRHQLGARPNSPPIAKMALIAARPTRRISFKFYEVGGRMVIAAHPCALPNQKRRPLLKGPPYRALRNFGSSASLERPAWRVNATATTVAGIGLVTTLPLITVNQCMRVPQATQRSLKQTGIPRRITSHAFQQR